jgi:hypothetical protein
MKSVDLDSSHQALATLSTRSMKEISSEQSTRHGRFVSDS